LAWIREQRSIHPTRNRTTRFSELIARLAARPAYA